jgi:hypothetical protein
MGICPFSTKIAKWLNAICQEQDEGNGQDQGE